jgi:hypothetical protein
MGWPPPTEQQLADAVSAYLATEPRSIRQAAKILGLSFGMTQRRLAHAGRMGLMGYVPPTPGMRVTQVTTDKHGNTVSVQQRPDHGEEFKVPAGHLVKGVSALLDEDGREIVKWVKTKEGGGLDIVEALQSAFKEYEGRAPPIPPPKETSADLLTLIPCNDFHVNLLTWARETGQNWDLKHAERVIGASIEDAIARSPASAIGVILGGGDLLHADTNENRTARSGNILEADGRHQKSLEVAQRLKVRIIDAALAKNDRVIVRILKGNHDEYSAIAVTYFLSAYYRSEPRVTVDLDASLFFYHRFGAVMLGATHGHTVKLKDMASIMAHRRAEDWGKTKFRYVHGFHIHHQSKVATEGNGVIAESHQAPIPQDAWHHGSGYLSGRSVQTITYHRHFGEISRVRVAILDAEKVKS